MPVTSEIIQTICVMERRHGFNLSAATSEENQDISRISYIACRLDIKREFRELPTLCMARKTMNGATTRAILEKSCPAMAISGWGAGFRGPL